MKPVEKRPKGDDLDDGEGSVGSADSEELSKRERDALTMQVCPGQRCGNQLLQRHRLCLDAPLRKQALVCSGLLHLPCFLTLYPSSVPRTPHCLALSDCLLSLLS